MIQANKLTTRGIDLVTLRKRMLLGAGIALILIAGFLYGVKHPNPEWGRLWMLKPLIVVPLAGAFGGLFYYAMDYIFKPAGWKKILIIAVSFAAYVISLWLGTVLGLNGTLWN